MATYYHITALAGVRYSLEDVIDANRWYQHECPQCGRIFYTLRDISRWDTVTCRANGRASDAFVKRVLKKKFGGANVKVNPS